MAGRTAPWPWWHQYTGSNDYRIRELLRAIMDLHAYYGDGDTWLWRGQANSAFQLLPAIHSRIKNASRSVDSDSVIGSTEGLLSSAREAQLDTHETTRLPDLALLAALQHYGAATPLMDVSLDPLVALYMATVSKDGAHDNADGVLFAIKHPGRAAAEPFDTRPFAEIYTSLPSDAVRIYKAPDVSERLKIQRGHFLLAKPSTTHPQVGIPLSIETSNVTATWLTARLNGRGTPGPPARATTDIACFRVTASFKPKLRQWLETRTDLTYEYVYPTPWHQPHLEAFATSQGRNALY